MIKYIHNRAVYDKIQALKGVIKLKKAIVVLLTTICLLLCISTVTIFAEENVITTGYVGEYINIEIDLQKKSISKNKEDVTANYYMYVIDNEVMLPIREFGELFGASAQWIQATKTVILSKNENTVSTSIDSNIMNVNGIDIEIRTGCKVISDRTFVPVSSVAEGLGYIVNYDEKSLYTIKNNAITYKLTSTGTLSINGVGEMVDYSSTKTAPWYDYKDFITSVIIEEGITNVSNFAFYDCNNLTHVTIPTSVTTIGEYAFENCKWRFDLYYQGTKEDWSNVTTTNSCIVFSEIHYNDSLVGETLFSSEEDFESVNGVITKYTGSSNVVNIPPSLNGYDIKAIAVDSFKSATVTIVVIPDGVTSIGNSVFYGCSKLRSIIIPDTITNIGSSAFYGCKSLKNIILPNKITSIEDSVFYNCSSLVEIKIPSSVTEIGYSAFYNCSSLIEIEIPNSVTSIGDSAFDSCKSLTSIDLPTSITIIYGNTFSQCSSLTDIVIPDSVTKISDAAFSKCSSLKNITIPDSVTLINIHVFYGCSNLTNVYISDLTAWCNMQFKDSYSNPLYYAENLFINGTLATDIVIPNSVTNIKESTFRGCSSLTKVSIPDSVESIGSSAFSGCTNLTYVSLPETLNSIGGSTFYNCYSLETISIPESVMLISSNAFYGCYSLTDVYYSGSNESWNKISIYETGNEALTNANIIYEIVIPTTYAFETNGGTSIPTITGEITEEPVTTKDGFDFIGWYDNAELTGKPVTFPYSGEATILYARWWAIGEEVRDLEYTIDTLTIRDISSNNIISAIPDNSFIAEVTVTNVSSEKTDVIMIVTYDAYGAMVDMDFVYADLEIGESISVGSLISNTNGEVYAVKAFVRPRINSLVPLAESKEITK